MISDQQKRRIVITGAAGRIGTLLTVHFRASPDYELVLIDREGNSAEGIHGADLSEFPGRWTELLAGADTVIHLAGAPSPAASWESVSRNNIDATFNLFRAAAKNKVRRVIYASSLQTMEGYRYSAGPIAANAPPRPTNFYAVSKLMGETIGRHFSEAHDLSVVCLRIGGLTADDLPVSRSWTIWGRSKRLSAKDLCQAVEKSVLTRDIVFAVLPLTSRNAGMRWDIAETERLLGYSATEFPAGRSPRLPVSLRSLLQFLYRRFLHPAWRDYRN